MPETTQAHATASEVPSTTKRRFLGLKTDPFIFLGAGGFIVVFVVATIIFGERARTFFSSGSSWVLSNLGWVYIGGVSLIFLFLVALFFSRYGTLKLGDDDEEPAHRLSTWFAMLFAAGLGAVLMFWGVAEPMNHAYNVPMGDHERMSTDAIREAFGFTFYHFGIHMWTIMTLPGLALGYFIYKRKLPPRLSSIFAPILGGRIYSAPGKLIDIVAIVGTCFGIAVSVGLGVLQINAGMNRLWGVPEVSWVQLLVVLVITVLACISVAAGLDKGIKLLSNINIGMAVVFLIFILLTGPTLVLLRFIVESFGIYVDFLPRLMFWTDSFNENPGWQGKWTVFYWAWSICWSPFVGMFIARISKGRTVREFIGGVLLLPSIFSVVWFAIIGRAGIEEELAHPGLITEPVVEGGDVPAALFNLLDNYPITGIVSTFALAIIAIFFVTSIDSAALVNDMFATGEENESPTIYRVWWGVVIGGIVAALLVISPDSGIDALQEVAIVMAVPFLLIQFVMMFSLLKGMHADAAAAEQLRTRSWEKTDSPEKLEEHENRPAPGYDAEGEPLPSLERNEDGKLVIPCDVVIDGELGVRGEVHRGEGERGD